ncbi:MAG: enoyl-CoA hydratase/isomerase family protein [Crocinitomicaceae bacterium]|nr:enoyl-CoA hydratase/isomerase family protein [Crocinitomicaceae bacterium]
MEQGRVTISKNNGIATISFFHPQSNSLPGLLLREIAVTIEQTGADESVRVIILRSEGEKAFCAGASFDELIAIRDLDSGKHFFSGFALVINAMRKCPQLIIARVHNKSVGGGVGIASAADYCFATCNASVKLSELAVGIGPFVVGPAVERKIGVSAMSKLAINATEWASAQWASEKGLYNEVFESQSKMDEAIEALAKQLSVSSPEAMRELKKILWKGTENWDELLMERAGISGRLVLSQFTRQAIEKFKSK